VWFGDELFAEKGDSGFLVYAKEGSIKVPLGIHIREHKWKSSFHVLENLGGDGKEEGC
jgi:hypothetical protein